MEQYLKDEYGVIDLENEMYFKVEGDLEKSIGDYIKDDAYGLFDCGQGYYQEEAKVLTYYKGKVYSVLLIADIGSQRMDRGDRLYFVDDIESVTVQEIDTPKEPAKYNYDVEFNEITQAQFDVVKGKLAEAGLTTSDWEIRGRHEC